MSYKVNGTSISLTRGDTFACQINLQEKDPESGEVTPYIPQEGDRIRFAMKESYDDPEVLLMKDIPISDCILVLKPTDTKNLPFGKYVYDIQLTKHDGTVDTFIEKATIRLTEEVD